MTGLHTIFRDFDLLFSDIFGDSRYHFKTVKDCEVKYPVFDQRYTDTEQQIIIAATGATKEDFDISLSDDVLSIKRTNAHSDKVSDVHAIKMTDNGPAKNEDYVPYKYAKTAISRKKFDIAFKIPKIWDAEKLEVELDKGELVVTIPIKEESKPKTIEFDIK